MSDGLAMFGGLVRRLFRYIPGNAGYTFTRADATTCATYIDANGVVQTVAANVLRDSHYIGGVRTTLLEGARTNLCLRSGDLANVAWTRTGTTTSVTGVADPSGGTSGATVTCSANGDALYQGITFTGNAVKAASIFLKAGTASVSDFAVFDVTASAYIAQIRATWTAGVPALTVISAKGTAVGTVACTGGWYRILITTNSATAANNNRVYLYPGGTVGQGSVLAWGGMAEDATFPSSYISTSASSVTRAADVGPHFPTGFGEQAQTWLAKYIDLGTQATGSAGVFAIGDEKTKPSLWVAPSSSTVMKANFDNSSAIVSSSGVTTSIAYGDTVWARFPFTASGAAQLGISRNSGAETLDTVSAGQALGTGFGGSIILLNDFNTTDTTKIGFMGLIELVGAAGIQSRSTMLSL